MNCALELGTIVTEPGHAGAALALRPRLPVPIDGFATITESRISMVNAPATSAPFHKSQQFGIGLRLDASGGGITSNDLHFGSILNFAVNILANSCTYPRNRNLIFQGVL